MTPDELELTKEVAKESVKQALAPVQDIIKALTGPAATEIGLTFGDVFKVYRFKRAVRLFKDLEQYCRKNGIQIKPVPPQLLLPIIEAASLQDDEDLHERWVALLANAANADFEGEVLTYFPDILRQLTSADAKFLEKAHDDIPNDALRRPAAIMFTQYDRISKTLLETVNPVTIDNLERLRLLSRNPSIKNQPDEVLHFENAPAYANHLYITALGKSFVRACRTSGKE